MDITDDSSLIAGGFADSTVRVWSVTPKKLRKVKSAAGELEIYPSKFSQLSSQASERFCVDRFVSSRLLYLLFFFFNLHCNFSELSLIDKESDDVLERIMDEKTASESKILYGHSGPVYAVSFSPDRLELQPKHEELAVYVEVHYVRNKI